MSYARPEALVSTDWLAERLNDADVAVIDASWHMPATGRDPRAEFLAAHIPGAKLLPRGQLELRVNQELPDPTRRVLVYCDFGKVSTLAAATLREMGYTRAVAMDGGMKAWREAGYPVTEGAP